MSTQVQKLQLSEILRYGHEALSNRRKDLFLIALFFSVIPDFIDMFAWQFASSKSVLALQNLGGRSAIDQIEAMLGLSVSNLAVPTIVIFMIKALGVLMIARTSVDYFESRPLPLTSVALRSTKVLLTKGFGAVVAVIIIFPLTSLIPFLAVITLSLMLMLPVTLVTSSRGGLKTAFDTLFLNYTTAARHGGKAPIFMSILAVAGFFLTMIFAVEFVFEKIPELDLLLQQPAGFFVQEVNFFGFTLSASRLAANSLNILWQAFSLVLVIPFSAAIYHLTTAPEGHQDFATVV